MPAPASLHRLRRADETQAGRETEAATETGSARGTETEAETAIGTETATGSGSGYSLRALTTEAGRGSGNTMMGGGVSGVVSSSAAGSSA